MISTPLVRAGADLAQVDGDEAVRQMIEQIIGTEFGELPWRPSFGTSVDALRHRSNDETTAEIARVRARDALRKWLPRTVEVLEVSATRAETVLTLRVRYRTGGREVVSTVVL